MMWLQLEKLRTRSVSDPVIPLSGATTRKSKRHYNTPKICFELFGPPEIWLNPHQNSCPPKIRGNTGAHLEVLPHLVQI